MAHSNPRTQHHPSQAYRLEDVFRWLLKNWFVLLIFPLLGASLGYVAQQGMPTVYQAKSKFFVDELPFGPSGGGTDAETERALVQTFIMGIPSGDMRKAVAEKMEIAPVQLSFVDVDRPLPLKGRLPQANIRIESPRNSRFGTIIVTSQKPEFAAETANAIVQELTRFNLIAGKIKHLKSALDFSKSKTETLLKPLMDISSERIKLERENAELAAYQASGNPLQNYPAFSNDATLNNLKTQLILVESQYEAIAASSTRGVQLEGKRSELAGLRTQVVRHAKSLASGLQSQFEIAANQEKNVQASLDAVRQQVQKYEELSARLVQSFGNLSMLPELSKGELGDIPDASSNVIVIMDRASVQNRPVSPKLWLNLLLGTFFGSALGLGFAVIRTQLDKKLTSAESLEHLTGLPCLAMLPQLANRSLSLKNSLGIGFLRSRLLGDNRKGQGQMIGFTPARSRQNCSRLVADLAILLAQAEKRTLIVDLHFDSPRQANLLGIEDCRSLNDWMLSEEPLEKFVSYSTICELAVLHPGNLHTDVDDLLSRRSFSTALADLLPKWDFILIDSPCILSDWTLMLTLPAQQPLIIVADYKTTTSTQVNRVADHARRPNWDTWGVVLKNCPPKVLKRLQG